MRVFALFLDISRLRLNDSMKILLATVACLNDSPPVNIWLRSLNLLNLLLHENGRMSRLTCLIKKIFRKGSNGVEEIFWLKHRVVYKVDKDNFTQSASIRRLMFHQTLDLVPSKRLRSSYRFQQIAKAKSSSSAISLLVSLMKINSKWSLSWVKIAVFLENVLGRLTLKWSEKNVSTIDQS